MASTYPAQAARSLVAATPRHGAAPPTSSFDRWKVGINKADENWDVYDCVIQQTVHEYNRHLNSTPGYFPLDWQLVKAMIWVETGAKSRPWLSAPMQIGNPDDPGLSALLGDREGGELIVPPPLRAGLSLWSVRANPVNNIQAGVGYLLMRLARFGAKSVADQRTRTYEVTVKAGDSLERIARIEGSTVAHLKQLNAGVSALRPGQVLKCQKASTQRVITGWLALGSSTVATYYNGGGDRQYGSKLDYALGAVRKRRAMLCR